MSSPRARNGCARRRNAEHRRESGFDIGRLTLHGAEIIDDLPGGGRRLDQRASGYRYILVSGQVITRDDQPTGALPGRLVRGPQGRPAHEPAAA